MLALAARLLKRLLVLAAGLIAIYVAAWEIYPWLNKRTPAVLALFTTYVVMAYGILPAAVRAFRLFYQPSHIPHYCVTPDGFASDPINIGLIGSQREVIRAMQKAGWYMAERRTAGTVYRLIKAILLRRPYPTAPFSPLYLFGRSQDLGFQLPVDSDPSNRHHVRFWACHLDGPEAFHKDVHFWNRFHIPGKHGTGRQLWVGAASKDIGIRPITHNGQLTHMIDPDTNAERDLIVRHLRKAEVILGTRSMTINRPYRLRNRVFRGRLHADGKITIVELKHRV